MISDEYLREMMDGSALVDVTPVIGIDHDALLPRGGQH